MSTGLRTTFWIHAIVSAVFGIGFLFLPDFTADLFGIEIVDPYPFRLFSAALLGIGLASVLSALAHSLERVYIVLAMEVGFTIVGLLVSLYQAFFVEANALVWVGMAVFAIFLVAFGYYYLQTRTVVSPEAGRPALR